jgi:sugar lactone lactonase YvrE
VWENFVSNHRLSFSSVASVLGVAFALGLSGCSANFGDVSSAATQTAMHIQGVVHGGQQPLSGAHVYMYAASTAAYGGLGIAPTSGATGNASTSLLTAATGNPADTNGNFYVTTDTFGDFAINGAFACTSGQQVYLYSTGGDPQLAGTGVAGTPNPAATLLAVVGDCASSAFPGVTSISMNEVTTVAAAYALAGFATDPLHIGAPSAVTGHALAGTGLANAFNTALNLVNQASGAPNPTLPLNSNAVVPVTTINTVANILASCVNSNGVSSSGCSTLFANTTYGTVPGDIATAAINMAQHPAANLTALLNLATNASPFQPFLSAPQDLSLGINYTGGSGLNHTFGIAIDGEGNAWVPNSGTDSVTKISSAGAFLSGTNGYTGGGLNDPAGIAIDGAGNAWVTNALCCGVTKISSAGAILSGTNGYTSGGLDSTQGIAIDNSGNAWVTNFQGASVYELTSTGTILSGDNGYQGGEMDETQGIAIDGSGNAWVANEGIFSVTKLSSAGKGLSGTFGYQGGGLIDPNSIAIDSSGSAWVTNFTGAVTKFSSAGTALSGTSGYTAAPAGTQFPGGIAIDGSGNAWVVNPGGSVVELSSTGTVLSGTNGYTGGGLNFPEALAIDGSGNIWVGTIQGHPVTELIGLATPVITPIVAGLPAIPTTDGTSNLGTRP